MERSILQTADKSNTILLSGIGETFHSRNGALAESMHVFIEAGYRKAALNNKTIAILEVGFGTGLNAILTFAEADRQQISIIYHGLEPYPLEGEMVEQLHHKNLLAEQYHVTYEKIQAARWNEEVTISPAFSLNKLQLKFEDFTPPRLYDLVYFDAFAPSTQPKLWTPEVFSRLYELMNDDGILVTYCAKGEVRRNLQAAGFIVERLPGAAGKREMLRAIKSTQK